MKKHLLSISSGLILMLYGTTALAQIPMLPQQVVMGPGYANEVYYQFTTFNTFEAPRASWDISFRTSPESAAVLINDGNLAILWSYPWADTTGWATLDTFGLYMVAQMFNDPDDWENGAFNRYSTGYPNYGWGVYNPATQIITGDSIYVMQLADGSFKKVWIVKKTPWKTAGSSGMPTWMDPILRRLHWTVTHIPAKIWWDSICRQTYLSTISRLKRAGTSFLPNTWPGILQELRLL